MKVCLVTQELSNVGVSGGIGTAFRELAAVLATKHEVHIVYVPVSLVKNEILNRATLGFKESGIVLHVIDPSEYCYNYESAEARSYSVYRFLKDFETQFDVVHFHDYRGLGYFPLMARRQGAMLQTASVVMQCHGPSFWTAHVNGTIFSDPSDLSVDYMERKSIEWSDYVVSPSHYLKGFLKDNGFKLPQDENVRVIKNVCDTTGIVTRLDDDSQKLNEVVFFGRHEDRKGIEVFCRAINSIANELAARNIQITFLGRLGQVRGMPSGLFVSRYASHWRMHVKFITGFDREASLRYLAQSPNQLVVIASTEENSPYTVAETVSLGKPLICSINGGGAELIDLESQEHTLSLMEPEPLAAKILVAIKNGAKPAKSSESAECIQQAWLQFHEEIHEARKPRPGALRPEPLPKVVLGITHFERPGKMQEAVMSALRQTYPNIEIVVVDDCSRSKEALAALDAVEGLLRRSGGKVIRRLKNGYLGAARNTIIKETESDYLLFLDDDDLALPNMVADLVTAALYSEADITNCFNLYLDVRDRDKYKLCPETFSKKVSYFPIGGPLSVTPIRNTLGSATSLIRRSAIHHVGGYTEIYGVGHEDYEFYVRALQAGMHLAVLPEPLYLYETGCPSMISSTSTISNFRRVLNAIDFSKNHRDWKNLIEVYAGQVASAHGAARREHHLDPLVAEIYATQYTEQGQHMGVLARWADNAGASNLAIAWLDAIESHSRSNARMSANHGEDTHINYIKFELLDQALALEDAPSKLDWIVRFLTENPNGEAFRRIRAHLESKPSGALRDKLIKGLRDLMPTFVGHDKIQISFLSQLVSFFAEHNRHAEANVLFSELLGRDERTYIERYDDLYKAFGAASDFAGVRHYIRYGRFEGRFGFENTLRLRYLLPTESPEMETTDIEQLMKFFDVKFRGDAPRKLLFNFDNFNVLEKLSILLQNKDKKT